MSILDKKRKNMQTRGIFAAVCAERLVGKSTLAGTAPGKVAMLTAQSFETGDQAALQLSEKLGNQLTEADFFEFSGAGELNEIIEALIEEGYETIYIDGMSGLTELLCRTQIFKDKSKKDKWEAWGWLAEDVEDVILNTKKYADQQGINIFYTVAIKPDLDKAGNVIGYSQEIKGNKTSKNIKSIFPTVITLVPNVTEEGETLDAPLMLTKTQGLHTARIDSILADRNPGVLEADLSQLIKLIRMGGVEQ